MITIMDIYYSRESMEDSIINNISAAKSHSALIMVMGVGGAGGNAVEHMWEMGIEGVNLAACNTDKSDLDKLHIAEDNKVLIGDGLGAGNNAEVGADRARQSLDKLRNLFQARGTRMLFIAAGMGGGTGTGAAPVIAELAHEMDILTVAIVTTPPRDEGPRRGAQASKGIEQLRQVVDSLIVLSNDAINQLYGSLPIANAFDHANDVVAFAAKGIAEIVTHENNLVNVDFADVCTVMRNSGRAIMGVASEVGDNRAEVVVDKIITSPLFGNSSIAGAKSVLINMSVAKTDLLTHDEACMVRNRVQQHAQTQDEDGNTILTNIIWGMSVKPNLKDDELEVVIVATGFAEEERTITPPIRENIGATPPTPPIQIKPVPPTVDTKRTERGVPMPIGRPSGDYAEIIASKRIPAYIAHNFKLTQAPNLKVANQQNNRDVNSGPMLLFTKESE